jgi:hypothetical protein
MYVSLIRNSHHPEYPRLVAMVIVKALLIPDEDKKDQANGYADTKTGNCYNRVDFIGQEISKGSLKVVSKHSADFQRNKLP